MPAVARELSITYAGVTVGGASDVYLLDGKYTESESYDRSTYSFTVVVNGATEAAFAANCLALEAAYRTPRGAFSILLGAATLKSLSHAGNTGYNATPAIAKQGDKVDTGRSRKYACSVEVERPADLAGQSGRRASTIQLTTEPGRRRTLALSGAYTALGGNSAREQHDASVGAWSTAILAAFGGTWEMQEHEETDLDDAGKNLGFRRSYVEIAIADGDPGPAVTGALLTIIRDKPSPGDSPERQTQRLMTFRADFTGYVRIRATDEGAATTPEREWSARIRPWIVRRVRIAWAPAGLAVISETFSGNPLTGQVNASMVFQGAASAGALLEYALEVAVSDESGKAIVPVWSDSVYAAVVFSAPARRMRIVTERTSVVGRQRQLHIEDQAIDVFGLATVLPEGTRSGWVTLSRTMREAVNRRGTDAETLDVTDREMVTTQQWIAATPLFG